MVAKIKKIENYLKQLTIYYKMGNSWPVNEERHQGLNITENTVKTCTPKQMSSPPPPQIVMDSTTVRAEDSRRDVDSSYWLMLLMSPLSLCFGSFCWRSCSGRRLLAFDDIEWVFDHALLSSSRLQHPQHDDYNSMGLSSRPLSQLVGVSSSGGVV